MWLKSLKHPQRRFASWLANLQEFDFTVVHRPGRLHANADALSRLAHLAPDCPVHDISSGARLMASLHDGDTVRVVSQRGKRTRTIDTHHIPSQ